MSVQVNELPLAVALHVTAATTKLPAAFAEVKAFAIDELPPLAVALAACTNAGGAALARACHKKPPSRAVTVTMLTTAGTRTRSLVRYFISQV